MRYKVQERFGSFAETVFKSNDFNEVQDFITGKVQEYILAEIRDSEEELSYEALEELEELFINDFYVEEIDD